MSSRGIRVHGWIFCALDDLHVLETELCVCVRVCVSDVSPWWAIS